MHFRLILQQKLNPAAQTDPEEFEYLQPGPAGVAAARSTFVDVKHSSVLLQPGSHVPALPGCSHVSSPDGVAASRLALTSGLGVTLKCCAIKLLTS